MQAMIGLQLQWIRRYYIKAVTLNSKKLGFSTSKGREPAKTDRRYKQKNYFTSFPSHYGVENPHYHQFCFSHLISCQRPSQS